MQLVRITDGATQALVSDGSGSGHRRITFNCIRGGETIDAREDKLMESRAMTIRPGMRRGVKAPAGNWSLSSTAYRVRQRSNPSDRAQPGVYV